MLLPPMSQLELVIVYDVRRLLYSSRRMVAVRAAERVIIVLGGA
jgi:hypothetical protein